MEMTICVPCCVAGEGVAGDGEAAAGEVGASGGSAFAPGGGGRVGLVAIHARLCACFAPFLNPPTMFSPRMSPASFNLRLLPPIFTRLPVRPPDLDFLYAITFTSLLDLEWDAMELTMTIPIPVYPSTSLGEPAFPADSF